MVFYLSENVEKERFYVVVEGLVVEEEFDKQAEVLAVDLVGVAIYLKHGQPVLPKHYQVKYILMF